MSSTDENTDAWLRSQLPPMAAAIFPHVKWCFHEQSADHGWPHITAVLRHALKALDQFAALTAEQRDLVLTALLLHEMDDPKMTSGQWGHGGEFARDWLWYKGRNVAKMLDKIAPVPLKFQTDVFYCVSLVTTSSQTEAEAELKKYGVTIEPWMLIPRDCDRLEAIGRIGIERCLAYNAKRGKPIICDSTPRPATLAEALAYATPERFADYKHGGSSASVVDHCFDKLFHLTCDDSGSSYTRETAAARQAEMWEAIRGYCSA